MRQCIEAGEDIVTDCRGGLGWSGMNSARLLVGSGVERVERGRATRPRAIETRHQEEWLRNDSPRPWNGPVRRSSNRRCFQ